MPVTVNPGWGPEAQYLAALGLGSGYQNPAQNYQASMYQPYRDIWSGMQPINAATGFTTPGWEDYIQNPATHGMGGIQNQAQTSLLRLLNMTAAKRTEEGFNFEPQYDPLTGQPVTGVGNLGQGTLQDLIQYGGASRFGPMGSSWLAGRLPQIQRNWQQGQAGLAADVPPTSFLDYLRARYGL